MARPRKDDRATVAAWMADPGKSIAATLGAAIMDGGWTSGEDAAALGVNSSNLSQVVARIKAAGYNVESRTPEGAHGRALEYRVASKRVRGGARTAEDVPVRREAAGTTHPAVGSRVTVRAVSMGPRGALIVTLSDGNGNAWTANVTGHISNGTEDT